ncbi:MAG: hypothetical protein U1C96_10255 [Gallionella sp.]|nr:hypothetical protein [Gallionella sp.]
MNKYKAAIFILSFISSHALADPLGDFLGAVVAGAIQSSIQGAGSIRSAEQYCEAIESNQLIRTFATQLDRYGAVQLSVENGNKFYEFQRLVMDNNRGQLTQWVYQRFGLRGPSDKCYGDCNERSKVVLRWAGACAAKHADDDLFLFFMHNLGTDRVEYERKKAKNDAEYSVYASAGGLDGHYLWVTLMAIALPNGISALEATGKPNVEALQAHMDVWVKEQEKTNMANAELARKAEEKQKAEQKFANSPNGKLFGAYQVMAAIKQCVDIREGYAMVYVNDVQYAKSKQLMRRIEAALNNKLQGTTADELWKKAALTVNVQNNFGMGRLLGVDEFQVCQIFVQKLDGIGQKTFGKSAPQKPW